MKQINADELLSYIDERIDVHVKHMERAKLNEEYGESYGATRALEDIKAYIEKRMGGRKDK